MNQRKRTVKLIAIIGCILTGAGVLLSGIGFATMGFSLAAFTYPRGGVVQQDTVHFTETPKKVEVYTSLGNVTVTGGQENLEGVKVDAATNAYQITMEQDTLVIKDSSRFGNGKSGWKWYQLINLGIDGDYDVTISLPESLLDDVYVENGLGRVELSGMEARTVAVHASAGDIEAENVSASKTLDIYSSMGQSVLKNCSGGRLTAESDMGSSTVKGCKFQEASITNSAGDISLESSHFSALTVSNDMGACRLSEVTAENSTDCSVKMGDIELTSLQSPQITLSAEAGNIRGTLKGNKKDYHILVNTDMGDSNLKDQISEGPNLLEVTTEMGDIDLKFTE